MPRKPTPLQDAAWWRAEAHMSAEDGNVDAACAAMAAAFALEAPDAPSEVITGAVAGYRRVLEDKIKHGFP